MTARAQQASEPSQTTSAKEEQLVSFVVAGETFALNIHQVKEIIRPIEVTSLPHAPAFVEGIISLRGGLVPIVDLRARLGLGGRAEGEETRFLVVETGHRPVGLVTDAVREVLTTEQESIDPAPDLASSVDAGFVRGVAKLEERLLILLDVASLVGEAKILDQKAPVADAAPSKAAPA